MSDPPREVVVTGIGCVSSVGESREDFWRNLLAGRRGLRRLTPADFRGLPVGEPLAFPLVGGPVAFSSAVGGEPLLRLVDSAAREAAEQACLGSRQFDPNRAACVVGTSKGGLFAFADSFQARRSGKRPVGDWTTVFPGAASTAVAARLGLRGPCLAPVAACATGLICVLRAADLIRDGACDLAVAGSGDASLHPAVLASFRRMGVLSTRFDEPETACRPFNADRSGFAVGEGAALFVLESRRHAEGRCVRPIASVLGGALLSDSAGLTAVDVKGEALARAVRETLARAGLSAAEIGHVNLHGTATRSNDSAEYAGLRAALGPALDGIACTALKGALGHQLGAAGSVELVATVLAIRDGRLPPTVTLTDPDPSCRLPLSRTETPVRRPGLKISLGFGGHVAVACLGPP